MPTSGLADHHSGNPPDDDNSPGRFLVSIWDRRRISSNLANTCVQEDNDLEYTLHHDNSNKSSHGSKRSATNSRTLPCLGVFSVLLGLALMVVAAVVVVKLDSSLEESISGYLSATTVTTTATVEATESWRFVFPCLSDKYLALESLNCSGGILGIYGFLGSVYSVLSHVRRL